MFDDVLIESAGRDRQEGGWITVLISTVIHVAAVGAVVAAGYYVKENPEVIEKRMAAFVAAAPPPPPPPPPPASNAGATPRRAVETPQETPRQEFRQPTEVPRDVPQVAELPSTGKEEEVDGGVPGGVPGGVKGGVVGGEIGGVIGGVVGGERGGQLGGQVGGTGDTPMRVGGNVKAPIAISQPAPQYTEIARKARIQGLVIVEAVIDREGNVTETRVLKALPMGLDQQALAAIQQWKFRPGTLNGQAIPVYFTLTVNFQLE